MHLTFDAINLPALLAEMRPSDGAVCLFVGVVRNENEGQETIEIRYEAYGPLAEAEMARITKDLTAEWPGSRVRIQHRVGLLKVGEASVAVAATAPHRAEAFAACRAAIDRLKTSVPIWKKEFYRDGSSGWVDPTRGKTVEVT